MDPNIALVLIASLNLVGMVVTAYFGYLAAVRSKTAAEHAETSILKSEENSRKLDVIKSDVKIVEIATNSMKDELVKATASASFAAGEKSERDKNV